MGTKRRLLSILGLLEVMNAECQEASSAGWQQFTGDQ